MAFCNHCGRRVEDDARTCEGCGSPVDGEAAAATALSAAERHAGAGRTIDAIRAYRESTGASLRQAKHAVETWQRTGTWPPEAAHSDQGVLSAEARDLASSGQKIAAIKAHRESTGATLQDAKDAVETWMRESGHAPARSGCAGSLLAVVLLFGGLLLLV